MINKKGRSQRNFIKYLHISSHFCTKFFTTKKQSIHITALSSALIGRMTYDNV